MTHTIDEMLEMHIQAIKRKVQIKTISYVMEDDSYSSKGKPEGIRIVDSIAVIYR